MANSDESSAAKTAELTERLRVQAQIAEYRQRIAESKLATERATQELEVLSAKAKSA